MNRRKAPDIPGRKVALHERVPFFSPKLLCAAVANFNSRHTLIYRTSACQPHREVRALPHSCVKILEAQNSYKWSINFPRKYQNKWPLISMPSVCWAPIVCEVFLAHASWPHNDSRRQIWIIPCTCMLTEFMEVKWLAQGDKHKNCRFPTHN